MASSLAVEYTISLGLALIVIVGANLEQDRAECADKLVGLATCLPYVGGDAKTPTMDCCSGLKEVVDKSKKCLCVLIKDRDDPNLGVKINSTLAMQLPNACHIPTNISKCVDLLHLAPNSSDAKVFEGLANNNGKTTTAPIPSGNSSSTIADTKSDGGMQIDRVVFGTLLWFSLLTCFLITFDLIL
ncbi:hypothetical protein L484_016701 [Morus notabilis]|uniref:Bifunctional inhibitor/plant lipid transfer protein/seed storage helical domain-containing protein n=1 Tax=Morus notabilis TaxID=981085 RepID=W9REV3_9ROSA|nr:protein YLS3 [Morus notabilis]EXB87355.1 hypothetical protein L484_016701 [Morus notabilis]